MLETGDTRVLVDPGAFSQLEDLGELDAVLVTHQHPDHVSIDWVCALVAESGVSLYVDPGTATQLAERNVAATVTRAGETFQVGGLTITPVGKDHAHIHPYVPGVPNVGLLFQADGTRLFHPGDALDGEPGEVDYLAVPINAPWAAIRETLEFVRRIAPTRSIIPIHDALLSTTGRQMYLTHLGGFGREGGIPVLDGADGDPHELD